MTAQAVQIEATPCVNPTCGTTGGYIQADCKRPWRTRGLCRGCYIKLYNNGGVPAINAFLATQAVPTPIRPEVEAEVAETVVQAALKRRAEYEARCALVHKDRSPDAGIVEYEPMTRQDQIDLLTGRLVRLDAEQDNLTFLIERDRAELAALRAD